MSQLVDFLMDKESEASGSHLMPHSPAVTQGKTKNPAMIRKNACGLETTEGQPGEQPKKAPQMGSPTFRVDTTGKEPPKLVPEKTAQHYALPSCSRYPLDSYADVKQASAYYADNWKAMAPVHRHEFCSNLSKRASALGITPTDAGMLPKYASTTYGSQLQVDSAFDSRVSFLKTAEEKSVLEELRGLQTRVTPQALAGALCEFDKTASIDHLYDEHILDPYAALLGKVAEDSDSTIVGNDYLSHNALREFARTNAPQLEDMYGDEFVNEFRKDPVAIFQSMPNSQKKVIARLVNSLCTDPTPT